MQNDIFCINCTVVELKHDRIEKENVDGNSINCTVVELKLNYYVNGTQLEFLY